MDLCAEIQQWPADEEAVLGKLSDMGVTQVALPWSVAATHLQTLAATLQPHGLSLAYVGLGSLNALDEEGFDRQYHQSCDRLRIAREAGAKTVGIASAHEGSIGFHMMSESVTRLIGPADRLGLCLCVRNMAGSALEQLDAVRALIRSADSGNVRLCLDSLEFRRAAINPVDAVWSFTNRLGVVRLRDELDGAPCRLGEGTSHVRATVEALVNEGFVGLALLNAIADPTAAEFVRAVIAEARTRKSRGTEPRP